MQPETLTLTPSAMSTTNIAGSQSPGSVGALTLTASPVVLEMGRIVGFLSSGNDSGISFTITGTDPDGNTISETVTGSSGAPGTAVSTKFYKTVTSVTTSGATAGTIKVGTVATTLSGVSNTLVQNFYERIAPQVAVNVTGTVNYTVQETFSDIRAKATNNAIWFSAPSAITAQTSNAHSQADVMCTGLRLVINSYSTGATVTMRVLHALNFGGE